MAEYRVTGAIRMESTGEEASYNVIVYDCDAPPNDWTILDFLMESGDIQIIPATCNEVDEFGVDV